MENNKNIVIDCRTKVKYDKVVNSLKTLKTGEAINLITNSDPKRLYFKMMEKINGNFYWVYRREGPIEWYITIKKVRDKNGIDN